MTCDGEAAETGAAGTLRMGVLSTCSLDGRPQSTG